jgi:hypothetical protein
MRHFIWLIATLGLLTAGCEDRQQATSSPGQSASPTDREPTRRTASIPADVSYSIIDSHTLPGVKRSLNVRLNKKVSQETLQAIALELKSQDSRRYDRTFIFYYLPGMTPGAGAWATTHFNLDLEVRILGLTSEQEHALVGEPTPSNREVIGRWLDEGPFLGGRITIFREHGKLYMELKFQDGTGLTKEVVENRSSLGRRFHWAEDSSSGDHWVIDGRGNLQVRDNEGLIKTAKRIE